MHGGMCTFSRHLSECVASIVTAHQSASLAALHLVVVCRCCRCQLASSSIGAADILPESATLCQFITVNVSNDSQLRHRIERAHLNTIGKTANFALSLTLVSQANARQASKVRDLESVHRCGHANQCHLGWSSLNINGVRPPLMLGEHEEARKLERIN